MTFIKKVTYFLKSVFIMNLRQRKDSKGENIHFLVSLPLFFIIKIAWVSYDILFLNCIKCSQTKFLFCVLVLYLFWL